MKGSELVEDLRKLGFPAAASAVEKGKRSKAWALWHAERRIVEPNPDFTPGTCGEAMYRRSVERNEEIEAFLRKHAGASEDAVRIPRGVSR